MTSGTKTTRALHGILAYRVGRDAPAHKILNCLRTVEDGAEACWSTEAVGQMGVVARVEVTRAFSTDVWSKVDRKGRRYVDGDSQGWWNAEEVDLSELTTDASVSSVIYSASFVKGWNGEWEKGGYPEIWGKSIYVEAIWCQRSAPRRTRVIAQAIAKLRRVPLVMLRRSMSTQDQHDAIDDAMDNYKKQAVASINRPFEGLAI